MSPNRKATAVLIGGLAIANALLVNDYASVVPSAESWTFFVASGKAPAGNAPEWLALFLGVSPALESSFFWQRSMSVIFWIVGTLAFFRMGKEILGELTALLSTLALAGSILLSVGVKMAISDAWLIWLLTLNYLFFTASLKQSLAQWKWAYWGTAIAALSVALLPTFLFSLSLGVYSYFLHPRRERMRHLYFWIGWPALALMVLMSGWSLQSPNSLWLDIHYFSPLMIVALLGLGLVPWIGFLPTAIWDIGKQWSQREEMTLFLTGWLLAGIFSMSMVVLVPLMVLCVRQAILHFKAGYPYGNFNKVSYILVLIALFMLMVVFILQSSQWFGAAGVRAAVLSSLLFWGLTFGVVIGLFAERRFLAWGSLLLAAPLTLLVLLIQYYPLLESVRSAPKEIVRKIKAEVPLQPSIAVDTLPPDALRQLDLYASMLNVKILKKEEIEGTITTHPVVTYSPPTATDTITARYPWWWSQIPADTVYLVY